MTDRACDACLARTWLLQRLAGHLEQERVRIEQVLELDDHELIAALGGRREDELCDELDRLDPGALRARSGAAGLETICACDAGYPAALRALAAPPAVLHVAGGLDRLLALTRQDMVAVVGARQASDYGLGVARSLGRGLSVSGLMVVSGMALGVDAAAHAGALEADAPTIAVLPGSAHRPYPARQRALHRRIRAGGVLVSELGPGTSVRRWTFLARNRIIAALAGMTVVVEAGEYSGSLVTARLRARARPPRGRRTGARHHAPGGRNERPAGRRRRHRARTPRRARPAVRGRDAPGRPGAHAAAGRAARAAGGGRRGPRHAGGVGACRIRPRTRPGRPGCARARGPRAAGRGRSLHGGALAGSRARPRREPARTTLVHVPASPRIPRVLSIAGSDSGGGAGIQADLKAFAACGAHGMTAITAITAQNTVAVTAVHPIPPEVIVAQVRAVAEDIGVDAVKIGMLGDAPTIEAVARAIDELPRGTPVVLDPVMVAESGAQLLDPDARATLTRLLFPRATVVTPNVPEARALVGDSGGDDIDALARRVHALGPRIAVITGGHRVQAIDVYFDGERLVELPGPRHPGGAAHGSGCTHSSVLAARLAHGDEPLEAARVARALASRAVADGLREIGTGAGPVDILGIASKPAQTPQTARSDDREPGGVLT